MAGACPKCGTTRRDDTSACARCGLAADRMAAFAEARRADDALPEPVLQAWERALAAWDDPACHDELFHAASQHGAYPALAARYRARAGDDIDDITRRQLERIRKAAEARMMATSASLRAGKAGTPYHATALMLIALAVIIAGAFLYAVTRSLGPRPTPPTPGNLR